MEGTRIISADDVRARVARLDQATPTPDQKMRLYAAPFEVLSRALGNEWVQSNLLDHFHETLPTPIAADRFLGLVTST